MNINNISELLEALKFANTIIERLSDDYSAIAGKHANYTKGEANKIEGVIKKYSKTN